MQVDRARWIASYPKSGNTWVRCFLQAYLKGSLDINFITTSLGDNKLHDYQAVCTMPMTRLKPIDCVWYRNAALMNLMMVHGRAIFKTHMANVEVNGIKVIPPDLTKAAIYLVRDPRAVALSYAKHQNIPIEKSIFSMSDGTHCLAPKGNPVVHWTSSWSDSIDTWQKTDFPTLILKYEDLKADPKIWFTKILETLDFEVNEEKLVKAIEMTELAKLEQQEEENGFIERLKQEKFFNGSGDWREVLTDTQIKLIEITHEEKMREFGYL